MTIITYVNVFDHQRSRFLCNRLHRTWGTDIRFWGTGGGFDRLGFTSDCFETNTHTADFACKYFDFRAVYICNKRLFNNAYEWISARV